MQEIAEGRIKFHGSNYGSSGIIIIDANARLSKPHPFGEVHAEWRG